MDHGRERWAARAAQADQDKQSTPKNGNSMRSGTAANGAQPSPRRRATRSRCGVYECSACALYGAGKCPGCASGNLRLVRGGETPCPVYECTRALKLAGCHECARGRCLLGRGAALRCQLRVRFGGERTSSAFLRQVEAAQGAGRGAAGRGCGRSFDRLRGYLQVLDEYEQKQVEVVSSHQLARNMGIRASLVRRDLAELRGLGTPGRGYEVKRAAAAIRGMLDLATRRPTIWLGVGPGSNWANAAKALEAVNCSLVGVFDDGAGRRAAGGLAVQPLSRAVAEVRRTGAIVAVVATERAARRELLEKLVEAGIKGILNLTSLRLDLPARVVVEQCDLGAQLLRLVSRLSSG